MRNHILFDLDGTLTDPKVGLIRSLLSALERMGQPLPPDTNLDWIIGPPIQHSIQKLLKTDDEAASAQCLGYFRERYTDIGLFENEVYRGIPEALTDLVAQGYDLYVATGKPKPFADRIAERFGLSQFFKGIYGSRLDGTRIEKADIIEDVLIFESISPEAALMVGDRKHDVLGAAKHGIPCIGVLYGYGSQDELVQARAAILCRNPGDLPALVGAYNFNRVTL